MGRGSARPARSGRLLRMGTLAAAGALVLAGGCGTGAPASPPAGQVQASAASDGLAVHVEARPSTPAGTVQVTVRADATHAPGALGYEVHFGDGTTAHNAVPQFCLAGPGPSRKATWHLTHRYARAGTYHLAVRVSINCTTTAATAHLSVRAG